MSKKLTTQEFVEKAVEVHGETYDYSVVTYINTKTKVRIICKIHGEFKQTPNNHIRGQGCGECYKSNRYEDKLDFVRKAQNTHNNKYNYNLVNYITSKTKVVITCKKHGNFEQEPRIHLSGHGCKKCGKVHIPTLDEFVAQSNTMHKNIYNYDKVKYVNSYTKIVITCKIHGGFKQTPFGHLQGQGCNKCNPGGFDKSKPGILYLIKYKGMYKIGITNNSVKVRYGNQRMKNINILKEIYFKDGREAFMEELRIKKLNKKFLYNKVNELTGTCSSEFFTKNILNIN